MVSQFISFFSNEYYPMVWMDYTLCIHSNTEQHLGCFQVFSYIMLWLFCRLAFPKKGVPFWGRGLTSKATLGWALGEDNYYSQVHGGTDKLPP